MTLSWASFEPAHFAAIVGTAGGGVGLALFMRLALGRPWGPAVCAATCRLLALLLLASWLAEDVVLIAQGAWTLRESLPLHLCDLALMLCAITLSGLAAQPAGPRPRRDVLQRCYELSYFWGLGGTTQAVLTPDIEVTLPDFLCIRFFVTHGGILVAVLLMTIGLRLRPAPGAALRAWLVTAALAPPVMLINWLLDANYMFLCGPPRKPSLYDYFGRWPWALLTLAAVGAVIFTLCYLPFWWLDRRHRERRTS